MENENKNKGVCSPSGHLEYEHDVRVFLTFCFRCVTQRRRRGFRGKPASSTPGERNTNESQLSWEECRYTHINTRTHNHTIRGRTDFTSNLNNDLQRQAPPPLQGPVL